MTELWTLFLSAAFVDNMPLTLFLGLCTFLALSKRPESAIGLGFAMIGVLGVTVPLNWLIYHGVLAPGAWAWAGRPELDLSYLSLIAFIGVIAAQCNCSKCCWTAFSRQSTPRSGRSCHCLPCNARSSRAAFSWWTDLIRWRNRRCLVWGAGLALLWRSRCWAQCGPVWPMRICRTGCEAWASHLS